MVGFYCHGYFPEGNLAVGHVGCEVKFMVARVDSKSTGITHTDTLMDGSA